MTSLEGVWCTAVRVAELDALMFLSGRSWPLVTVVNGPLMARRPLRPELAAPLGLWPSFQLAMCVSGRQGLRLCGVVAVLLCCMPSGRRAPCGPMTRRSGAGVYLAACPRRDLRAILAETTGVGGRVECRSFACHDRYSVC